MSELECLVEKLNKSLTDNRLKMRQFPEQFGTSYNNSFGGSHYIHITGNLIADLDTVVTILSEIDYYENKTELLPKMLKQAIIVNNDLDLYFELLQKFELYRQFEFTTEFGTFPYLASRVQESKQKLSDLESLDFMKTYLTESQKLLVETAVVVQELTNILAPLGKQISIKAIDYFNNSLKAATLTHELSFKQLMHYGFGSLPFIPADKKETYTELLKKFSTFLEARGYRKNIFTIQEHKLFGSNGFDDYLGAPHTPIGILSGELTVYEVNIARSLEKCMYAYSNFLNKDDLELLKVTLEPLDEEGKTLSDPHILNESFIIISTTYSADFPYKRK